MSRLKKVHAGMYKSKNARGVIHWRWSSLQTGHIAIGYHIRTMALDNQEDTPEGNQARIIQCTKLQQDLREWIAQNKVKEEMRFLGTVNSLADFYEQHPKSPIKKVAHNTRKDYLYLIGRIRKLAGEKQLTKIGGLDFISWFDELAGHTEPRKIRFASATLNMWRMMVSWGVVLELAGSIRVQTILSNLRFETAKPRIAFLTFEQVVSIINQAWLDERPSIALAQALQFECALRQVDVIGQWVPLDRRNPSKIISQDGKEMWINGLTWDHIDDNWILKKATSKTGGIVNLDLKLAPLVTEQIERMFAGKRLDGPIVISEATRLPYRKYAFAEMWRKIATKADVPNNIYNMDSRSGGITEATDAGVSLEGARHLAQHTRSSMTARYSRNTLSKTREAATARLEMRGQKCS